MIINKQHNHPINRPTMGIPNSVCPFILILKWVVLESVVTRWGSGSFWLAGFQKALYSAMLSLCKWVFWHRSNYPARRCCARSEWPNSLISSCVPGLNGTLQLGLKKTKQKALICPRGPRLQSLPTISTSLVSNSKKSPHLNLLL